MKGDLNPVPGAQEQRHPGAVLWCQAIALLPSIPQTQQPPLHLQAQLVSARPLLPRQGLGNRCHGVSGSSLRHRAGQGGQRPSRSELRPRQALMGSSQSLGQLRATQSQGDLPTHCPLGTPPPYARQGRGPAVSPSGQQGPWHHGLSRTTRQARPPVTPPDPPGQLCCKRPQPRRLQPAAGEPRLPRGRAATGSKPRPAASRAAASGGGARPGQACAPPPGAGGGGSGGWKPAPSPAPV